MRHPTGIGDPPTSFRVPGWPCPSSGPLQPGHVAVGRGRRIRPGNRNMRAGERRKRPVHPAIGAGASLNVVRRKGVPSPCLSAGTARSHSIPPHEAVVIDRGDPPTGLIDRYSARSCREQYRYRCVRKPRSVPADPTTFTALDDVARPRIFSIRRLRLVELREQACHVGTFRQLGWTGWSGPAPLLWRIRPDRPESRMPRWTCSAKEAAPM